MRFLKLRIAWSVMWGLACVLLIVLWVRSYWWVDSAYFQFRQMPTIGFLSGHGRAILGVEEPGTAGTQAGIESDAIGRETSILDELPITAGPLGFYAKSYATGWTILAPMYFLVLLSATLAVVPWLPWWPNRFSLRTLLIATTLVAVVLGAIVWATRYSEFATQPLYCVVGFFMRGRMAGMKQFSIRDLLFLIVIAALALGWWQDRRPIPARFQMQTVTSPNGSNAYVLDTATGQVWDEHTPGFTQSK